MSEEVETTPAAPAEIIPAKSEDKLIIEKDNGGKPAGPIYITTANSSHWPNHTLRHGMVYCHWAFLTTLSTRM